MIYRTLRFVPVRKLVLASRPYALCATVLIFSTLGSQAAVLTTLFSFTNSADGWNPVWLARGRDGNFYGATTSGGIYNYGTVYRITTNGMFTKLYSFTGGSDGLHPGGLTLSTDGNFYGITAGDTGVPGTLFKITPAGVLSLLHSFGGGNLGDGPVSPLVQGNDGALYGMTTGGGAGVNPYGTGNGTLYRITTSGLFTLLYSFGTVTNANGDYLDGAFPVTGPVLGSDGSFYGTANGGTNLNPSGNGCGTIFRFSTNGALTTLYDFGAETDSNGDSFALSGAMVARGSDGNLYGTAARGGPYPGPFGGGSGAVFKLSTNSVFTILHLFTGGEDGYNPSTGLLPAENGSFYGATSGGGAYPGLFGRGYGTIFKITTNGALTTLYSFGAVTNPTNDDLDGNDPGGLVLGSDGNLYGTTVAGGASGPYGGGTIFRLTIMPSPPVFQAAVLTNNALNLTWTTEVGATYQLQYTSDLTSTNWTNLGSPLSALGTSLSATDPTTSGPQRFYRVMLDAK